MPLDSAVTPTTTQNIGIASTNMTEQMRAAIASQEAQRNRESQSADYARLNTSREAMQQREFEQMDKVRAADRAAEEMAYQRDRELQLELKAIDLEISKAPLEAAKQMAQRRQEIAGKISEHRGRLAAATTLHRAAEQKNELLVLQALQKGGELEEGVRAAQDVGYQAGSLAGATLVAKLSADPDSAGFFPTHEQAVDPETVGEGGGIAGAITGLPMKIAAKGINVLFDKGGVEELRSSIELGGLSADHLLQDKEYVQRVAKTIGTEVAGKTAPQGKEGAVADSMSRLFMGLIEKQTALSGEGSEAVDGRIRASLAELEKLGVSRNASAAIVSAIATTMAAPQYLAGDVQFHASKEKSKEELTFAAVAPVARVLARGSQILQSASDGHVLQPEEIKQYTDTLVTHIRSMRMTPQLYETIVANPWLREKLYPVAEEAFGVSAEHQKYLDQVENTDDEVFNLLAEGQADEMMLGADTGLRQNEIAQQGMKRLRK